MCYKQNCQKNELLFVCFCNVIPKWKWCNFKNYWHALSSSNLNWIPWHFTNIIVSYFVYNLETKSLGKGYMNLHQDSSLEMLTTVSFKLQQIMTTKHNMIIWMWFLIYRQQLCSTYIDIYAIWCCNLHFIVNICDCC